MYSKCQNNKPQDVLSHTFTSGYYDYNHFLKEFKQIIGVSPTKYNWK